MTKIFSVREAGQELPQLLQLAKDGIEVYIAEGEVRVARLTALPAPSPAPRPRVAGLHAGAIQTRDDFDKPLPDEFWLTNP